MSERLILGSSGQMTIDAKLYRELPATMDGKRAAIYTGRCPYCGEHVGILTYGEEWSLFEFVRKDQESGAAPEGHKCTAALAAIERGPKAAATEATPCD